MQFMSTNFCMWCFKYETVGQVWLGFIMAKTDEILPVKLLSRRVLLSVAMPSNFTTSQLCTTLVSVRAINLYKSGY
jgi:hypothetical protein